MKFTSTQACVGRRDEPAFAGTPRSTGVACRCGRREEPRGTHAGRHLCASAQQPSGLDQALCPASIGPCAAGAGALHDQTSARLIRRARHDAWKCPRTRSRKTSLPGALRVFPWQLGPHLARRRNHVQLHVCARGPPSWTNHYARAATGLPVARQSRLWHLALGEVVEGQWICHAAEMRKQRTRRRPAIELTDS